MTRQCQEAALGSLETPPPGVLVRDPPGPLSCIQRNLRLQVISGPAPRLEGPSTFFYDGKTEAQRGTEFHPKILRNNKAGKEQYLCTAPFRRGKQAQQDGVVIGHRPCGNSRTRKGVRAQLDTAGLLYPCSLSQRVGRGATGTPEVQWRAGRVQPQHNQAEV